jgi:hypothetical protein
MEAYTVHRTDMLPAQGIVSSAAGRKETQTYPGSLGTSGFGGPPSGRFACTLDGRFAYVVSGCATKRSKYERCLCLGGGGGGAGGILGAGAADERRSVICAAKGLSGRVHGRGESWRCARQTLVLRAALSCGETTTHPAQAGEGNARRQRTRGGDALEVYCMGDELGAGAAACSQQADVSSCAWHG